MARAQGLLVDDGDRYRLTAHACDPRHLAGSAGRPARRPRARAEAGPAARRGPGRGHRRRSSTRLGHAERAGDPALAASRTGSCATRPTDATTPSTRCCARSPTRRCPATSAATCTAGPPPSCTEPEERARHLDRAAGYLADDAAVAAEAAEALADAGHGLFAAARAPRRPAPARAGRGARVPAAVGSSGPGQAPGPVRQAEDDAFETLAMVAGRPRRSRRGRGAGPHRGQRQGLHRPGWALPRLEAVTERWHDARTRRQRGVGPRQHRRGLLQPEPDGRGGRRARAGPRALRAASATASVAVAASSFLCLARPTDRRVPRVAGAGALSSPTRPATGRGSSATLTTLAWHHFIRSLWGGARPTRPRPRGSPAGWRSSPRSSAPIDMAVHGRSLLAIMARFSGRLDEAAAMPRACSDSAGVVRRETFPWLGWAATFAVAVAGARPRWPLRSPPTPHPTPWSAWRSSSSRRSSPWTGGSRRPWRGSSMVERPELGPFGDLAGVLNGLALSWRGRPATTPCPGSSAPLEAGPGPRCPSRR